MSTTRNLGLTLREEVANALARLKSPKPQPAVKRYVKDDAGQWHTERLSAPDDEPDDSTAIVQQRYEQFTRMMILIELLAPLRGGATLKQLMPDINAEFGKCSDRTVRRDLEALTAMGLVTHEPGRGAIQGRWFWHDDTFRGVLHLMVARSMAIAKEARQEAESLRKSFARYSTVEAIRRHAEAEGWKERA